MHKEKAHKSTKSISLYVGKINTCYLCILERSFELNIANLNVGTAESIKHHAVQNIQNFGRLFTHIFQYFMI